MRALRHEAVDRMPWTPLIDGYFLSSCPEYPNQVDVLRAAGADVMARHVPTFGLKTAPRGVLAIPLGFRGDKVAYLGNEYNETVVDGGGVEIHIEERHGNILQRYTTPVGTIEAESTRTPDSPFIPFPRRHLIKTVDDIAAYRCVREHQEFVPAYDQFTGEDVYIGDSGIATASGPTSPFHELLEIVIGIENFYYLMMDHEDEVVALMDLMHRKNLEAYKVIAESPAKVVIDYENTSTTTTSPDFFAQYGAKHINDYAAIMRESGKIFLTHMCGKLRSLESPLRSCEMDGIVDIAPPPTGDVPLADAKSMWGAEKVVMGGIDATAFVKLSPDELYDYAADVIKSVSGQTGVFLGSADATPIRTTVENLAAVTRAVDDFG